MGFGIRRADVIARGKKLMKVQAVYGGVRYTECYHLSPDCYEFAGQSRSRKVDHIARYENSAEAFAAGHLRACEVCVTYINVDVDGRIIQITPEQADTLSTIARLRRIKSSTGESKYKLTQYDVAAGRGRTQPAIHSILKSMITKGLVNENYDGRSSKLKPVRGIELTALGQRVLDLIPAY